MGIRGWAMEFVGHKQIRRASSKVVLVVGVVNAEGVWYPRGNVGRGEGSGGEVRRSTQREGEARATRGGGGKAEIHLGGGSRE